MIIVNGQVAGLWKRMNGNDEIIIEANFFQKPAKEAMNLMGEASDRYSHFINKTVRIITKDNQK